MAKQEWTVRVVVFDPSEDGPFRGNNEYLSSLWVEQMRYMGHAKELAVFDEFGDGPPRKVVEFYAPRGADSIAWANQNADRMRSFGFNAAAAPKWDPHSVNAKTHPLDQKRGAK